MIVIVYLIDWLGYVFYQQSENVFPNHQDLKGYLRLKFEYARGQGQELGINYVNEAQQR